MSSPALTIVIPVYNEESQIEHVIQSTLREIESRQIPSQLWVGDDGSTDGTPETLERLATSHAHLKVTTQANRGHGPTVSRGYRDANGMWIFQLDGDGEVPPEAFGALWDARGDADLVLGWRRQDSRPLARRVVSRLTSLTVRLIYGGTVHDPNVPFRLLRREAIAPLLRHIPPSTFAPNVALTGLAIANGLRIREVPVPMASRDRKGRGFRGARLLRVAVRAWLETVAIGLQFRRLRHMSRTRL